MAKKPELNFEDTIYDGLAGDLEAVERPLESRAFSLIVVLAVAAFAAAAGRLFYISFWEGDFYAGRAEANATRVIPIKAPRGVIFDRFGAPLVENEAVFNAVLIPSNLPRDYGERRRFLNELTKMLQMSEGELKQKLEEADLNSYNWVLVKKNLSLDEMVALKTANLKGIVVENDYRRRYPKGEIFSHLVGYIGPVTKEDLKNDSSFILSDSVGKEGLEAYYDRFLRGEAGYKLSFKDAQNSVVSAESEKEPRSGQPLFTSIDAELQEYFYNRLKNQLADLGIVSGAGLALNPKNGEIMTLISLPSFDSNKVSEALSSSARPFFNRVISGVYAPGSTIKPLLATAALKEKIISPEKSVFSSGRIEIPNPYQPESPSVFLDWKPHGWVNLRSALARSSNVYFYSVGGGFGDIRGLGIDRLREYWRKFGLGEKSGVDLVGESAGFLPSSEEKEERTGDIWRVGDTYNVSIGQGDLLATPLQILNYIAAIGSGRLFKPYVVKNDGLPAAIRDFSDMNGEFKEVAAGMRDAVSKPYGTANFLADLPLKVAGKTGSAQIENNTKTNAFFVGYAPADDPELAVLVLIENAQGGSLNAVPVARDVFLWYYKNRYQKSF